MTEKKIRELFKLWIHRLGLDLWHIEIRVENPENKTAMLAIRRSSMYHRAIVSVPPWLLDGGPVPDNILDVTIDEETIEACVVHELLHCCRHQTHAMVFDRLDGQVHRDVYTVVTEEFNDLQELEIENLAVALVRAWRHV